MTMLGNNVGLMNPASSGYQLARSLRFRLSASAYISKTMGAGGGTTKCAFSAWLKRGTLGVNQTFLQSRQLTTDQVYLSFTNDALEFGVYSASTYLVQKISTAVFRDIASWYHIVVLQDTTLAAAEDRFQIWVNGSHVTSWSTNTNTFPQNTATLLGAPYPHYINGAGGVGAFDGLMTEVNFVYQPTTVPTPSSFGAFDSVTGVWAPKKYTGTYGTNGFYLPFSDNSALTTASNVGLGKDFSGNGNYWVTNNVSITAGATYDSFTDVPTLTSATASNFATLNPLDKGAAITLSDGNLTADNTATAAIAKSTIGVSSGKWYWEITVGAIYGHAGIANAAASLSVYIGLDANGWAYNSSNGLLYTNGATSGTNATWMTVGDVIGFAFDATAGTLAFYKNGSLQPSSFSGIPAGTYHAAIGTSANGTNHFNFGQRPFTYTPPTGFLCLNTYNLPAPAIVKGSQYFDVVARSGTDATLTQPLGFQPDFLWSKCRTVAVDHNLADSVRGTANLLYSNLTNAEDTSNALGITTSGSGYGTNSSNGINGAGRTYVDWLWKKGATPGFDIVTYVGNGAARTINHALGVAPKLLIIKDRSTVNNWLTWHTALAGTEYLSLNTADLKNTSAGVWNSTVPTSSVFSLGGSTGSNLTSSNYIAYLWAEIPGFSKFGSYTGNGSTNGPFVYCGFRPRYVLIKGTAGTKNWAVIDSARNAYNIANNTLFPDLTNVEQIGTTSGYVVVDFLSNGFKIRMDTLAINTSAETFIYAAFAESPFKHSLAR